MNPTIEPEHLSPVTAQFIARWQAIVATKDIQGLFDILAPDVMFHSPIVYKPYQGREATTFLLANVTQIFADLTYTSIYTDGRGGVVMHFETTLDTPDKSMHVEGVDLFQLSEQGQVLALRVMIRPLSAAQALAQAMQAKMAGS